MGVGSASRAAYVDVLAKIDVMAVLYASVSMITSFPPLSACLIVMVGSCLRLLSACLCVRVMLLV